MIPGAEGWTLESWYSEFGGQLLYVHTDRGPWEWVWYFGGFILVALMALVMWFVQDLAGAWWEAARWVTLLVMMAGTLQAATVATEGSNAGMTFAHGNVVGESGLGPSYLPGFSMTMGRVVVPCTQGHLHWMATQEAEGYIMMFRHGHHGPPEYPGRYPFCCYRKKEEPTP